MKFIENEYLITDEEQYLENMKKKQLEEKKEKNKC